MTTSHDLCTEEINKIYSGLALEAQKQMIPNLQNPKKRVIVIAGPTATGKTSLSIRLAQLLDGEVISADSMQVYKGMDIGTAKVTLQEQLTIPHHLIDICEPADIFNVVDFYFEARQAIQTVLAKDKVPIIVGGSGFYLHSLLYGPPSGPPPVQELRDALEKELDEKGADVMFERLRELDPQYACTITNADRQKIIRGLEIITLTGKKVSKHNWGSKQKPQGYDFRCWFLHRPRDKLYARIEERCDIMVQEGLIAEVERLQTQGLMENSSACQAIGYRQVLDFLQTDRSEQHFSEFVKSFKQASRHYAKRQFTWFRKEPLYRWVDIDLHDPEVVVDIIQKDYLSR